MEASELENWNAGFEKKTTQEVLSWAAKRFSPKITLASSFGAEDAVLIDLISKLNLKIPVFTLDTGRLNEETYEVMDRIRRKYGVAVVSYFPDAAKVEALVNTKGFFSFRESVENRKECCAIRKIEPLNRALKGMDAWITGLRREQSVTRTAVRKIEPDETHPGLVKINPLADWTEKQVWDHIKENQVPYNRLHDAGYPSIGCAPCTRAVRPGEDVRAGRWWWENADHKECGLHLPKRDGK